MSLNMNVGLGPMRTGDKSQHKSEDATRNSFTKFVVSTGNDSNLDDHPFYNLPDEKQVSKLLSTKKSIGSRYLHFDPNTAQDEARKQARNRSIPLEFRNKRRINPTQTSPSQPPRKKLKPNSPQSPTPHDPHTAEQLRRVSYFIFYESFHANWRTKCAEGRTSP